MLVRADLNVPLDGGIVADDTRIRAALPTIELLLERGAAVVLCSHLGRPKDREPELSMAPVAERLGELLDLEVQLAPGVVGDEVRAVAAAPTGQVLLLENTRYEPGETKNDPDLAAGWRSSPTSTSTMPSAPPTAPTPPPRASPTTCPPSPGCCSSASCASSPPSPTIPTGRSWSCSAARR